jgi:hypothetical protein
MKKPVPTRVMREHPDLDQLKRQAEHTALTRISQCAVKRRRSPMGAKPIRQLSLQPVAIGAVMEVTKSPKPSV